MIIRASAQSVTASFELSDKLQFVDFSLSIQPEQDDKLKFVGLSRFL